MLEWTIEKHILRLHQKQKIPKESGWHFSWDIFSDKKKKKKVKYGEFNVTVFLFGMRPNESWCM